MIKAAHVPQVCSRIEYANALSRRRAKTTERIVHGPQHAFHISICEYRSNQSGDFPIARVLITVYELDRVVGKMFLSRKVVNEMIEMMLQKHTDLTVTLSLIP